MQIADKLTLDIAASGHDSAYDRTWCALFVTPCCATLISLWRSPIA